MSSGRCGYKGCRWTGSCDKKADVDDVTRNKLVGGLFVALGVVGLLGSPLGQGSVKFVLFPRAVAWLGAPAAWGFLAVQLVLAGWYRNLHLAGAVVGIAGLMAALVWINPWHIADSQMYARYGVSSHRQMVMMGQAISGLIVGAGFFRGWWAWKPGRQNEN
jgi:hypothetical protein